MHARTAFLIAGFLLSFGGAGLLCLGFSTEIKKVMPSGYTLMCSDNGKYKWRGRGYIKTYGTSKQGAIDGAWQDYNGGEYAPCEEED